MAFTSTCFLLPQSHSSSTFSCRASARPVGWALRTVRIRMAQRGKFFKQVSRKRSIRIGREGWQGSRARSCYVSLIQQYSHCRLGDRNCLFVFPGLLLLLYFPAFFTCNCKLLHNKPNFTQSFKYLVDVSSPISASYIQCHVFNSLIPTWTLTK